MNDKLKSDTDGSMTPRQEAFVKNWKNTRARGKQRMILFNGILLWALPVALIMQGLNVWRGKPTIFVEPWFGILFYFLLWSAGGVVYALIVWNMNEKQYSKLAAGNLNP